MLVLGVDTSTRYLSAAICDGDIPLIEFSLLADRRHAERLVDVVDRMLGDADLTLTELDLLAVTAGPGSFTGLRIGVSTMKGLAQGAGLPLVGVPSLDAMARQFDAAEGLVCPLLDARMDEVYSAVYRCTNGTRAVVRPASVGPVEEALTGIEEPLVVFGEGARNYADRIGARCPGARIALSAGDHARGAAVALEAKSMVNAGANSDAALVRPVYLRQSQPEEARRRAREAANA